MKISILHISDCPSLDLAEAHVRTALAATGQAATVEVATQLIATPKDARAHRFAGSPTILFDGVDAFPSEGATEDLACRVYVTPEGLRPAPTVDQLLAAIDAA